MTDTEIYAEAKRRTLRSNPSLTSEAFDAWLADALGAGASIVLHLDGCYATYPLTDAPASKVRAAKGYA